MALTRVQATPQGQTALNPTLTLTFPAPPTVGNAVVVLFSSVNGPLPSTGQVTDNRGNSYNLVLARANNVQYASIFLCPALTATGSPFTITIALTGGTTSITGRAIEVGGITGGSLRVDRMISATGNNATPATGATDTLRTTGDALAVGVVTPNTSMTAITVESVSPVWTQEYEQISGTNTTRAEGDSRLLTTPGGTPQSISWTTNATGLWAAVLVVFASAADIPSGIYRVQATTSVAIMTTGTATGTLTFAAAPTVGNAIVVPVTFAAAGTMAAGGLVTDNRGNVYELVHVQTQSASVRVCVYACLAVVATGTPFTLTLTASFLGTSAALDAVAIEVGGFTGGALAVDRRVGSGGTSTTPTTGPTAALRTTASGAFVVAVLDNSNGPTTSVVESVTPAWLEEYEVLAGASRAFGEADSRVLSAPNGTTQSGAWTLGTSQSWAACLVVFASADLTPLAEARVTQDTVETLSLPILPAARVTQEVVELLSTSVSLVAEGRVTQAVVETLSVAAPPVTEGRLTQAVIEVLGTLAPLVPLAIEPRAPVWGVGTTGPVDTTGCSLLVIGVPCLTGTSPAVGDSKGNTYIPLTAWGSPGNAREQFFYCLNGIVGPAHTFSVSPATLPCIAFAFTNVQAYQAETGTGYGSTPTAPQTTGSLTPARDGALVLTGLTSTGNGVPTDSVLPPGFAVTQVMIEPIQAWGFIGPVGVPSPTSPNFNVGDVVVVDGTTYTFKAALDGALGTVRLGSDFNNSLEHLAQVISTGGDGVVGTTGTPPNSLAFAWLPNTRLMRVMARTAGTAGNSIALTTTSVNALSFWEGAIPTTLLLGGVDGPALTESMGWAVQPVAAPINPSWSWTHAPTDVALTTAVFLPVIGYWTTPARVTQALIEILQTSPPPVGTRLTQAAVEVFAPQVAPARVTQLAVDVLRQIVVTARNTQNVVEVFLVLPPCTTGAFPVDDLPAGGSCPIDPLS